MGNVKLRTSIWGSGAAEALRAWIMPLSYSLLLGGFQLDSGFLFDEGLAGDPMHP